MILAVQRHPETKSTWALRFVCAFTRSLAPCRRSLLPLLAIYPTRREETSLVSFGHRVVRDRPVCCSDPISLVSLHPSAPPTPPYSPPTSISPLRLPLPRPRGGRGGVSNPGKLCFPAGEGLLIHYSSARTPAPLSSPLARVRARGRGRDENARPRPGTRKESTVSRNQVACRKRARAVPCRSPGAGPATNLGSAHHPRRAAPPPQ